LRKLFSTLTKGGTSSNYDEDDLEIQVLQTKIPNVPMAPATYLKPLQHKLEPRQEPRFRGVGYSFADRLPAADGVRESASTLAITMNRERTALLLNGGEEEDLAKVDLDNVDSKQTLVENNEQACRSEEIDDEEDEESIEKKITQHHEQVAISAAQDHEAIPQWIDYIECYAKVKYTPTVKDG
jgi:hypothetical protein